MRGLVEVKLVSELTDPQKVADITGGILTKKGKIPWTIEYKQGNLLWAGYPDKPKEVSEAVPFLEVREPRAYGTSLIVCGAILTPNSMIVATASFGKETCVSGYIFTGGNFSEVEIPITLDPWGCVLREIRDSVRQFAANYPGNLNSREIHIEQG